MNQVEKIYGDNSVHSVLTVRTAEFSLPRSNKAHTPVRNSCYIPSRRSSIFNTDTLVLIAWSSDYAAWMASSDKPRISIKRSLPSLGKLSPSARIRSLSPSRYLISILIHGCLYSSVTPLLQTSEASLELAACTVLIKSLFYISICMPWLPRNLSRSFSPIFAADISQPFSITSAANHFLMFPAYLSAFFT